MEEQGKVNLKRKRPEIPKPDIGSRVSGKLHHELHEVHHACKKARTFETQKLVKRLKQLRVKGEDKDVIQDHEAQLESIKTIDHNRLANTAFKSKILKDKLLRENTLVQDALIKEIQSNVLEPLTTGTPLAKVQSRLLSSKIIASQVSSSLGALKAILNPDTPPNKRTRPEPADAVPDLPRPTATLPAQGDDDPSYDDSDSSESAGKAASDEDAGWESGTIDSAESEGELEGNSEAWGFGSVDGSDQSEDSDDDSTTREKPAPPPKKSSKKVVAAPGSLKAKVESTFLPSLSVGYIPGSEDSDDENGVGTDPRKNRRGQRARRAIWEKKYGRNANHKKQEMAQKFEEKARMRTRGPTPLQLPDNGYQRTGARGCFKAPDPPKKADSEKPLHPSWEAKRRMKETQSDAIVPSQGKKIKF